MAQSIASSLSTSTTRSIARKGDASAPPLDPPPTGFVYLQGKDGQYLIGTDGQMLLGKVHS